MESTVATGRQHRSPKGVGAAIKGWKPQGSTFESSSVAIVVIFLFILYFNEEATSVSHETLVSGGVGGN